MSDIANRDEALKCIEIARQALAAADSTRAERFAQKALRLYRCPQVRRRFRFWGRAGPAALCALRGEEPAAFVTSDLTSESN
jgi:hypothetical protein